MTKEQQARIAAFRKPARGKLIVWPLDCVRYTGYG
jgi:hypothetical protein